LQVKTTSVAGASPGECSTPSVSGSEKVGASVPTADVGRIGNGGDPAVAPMVDATGQRRRLVARVLDVDAVDANGRRTDEAVSRGALVGVDVPDLDRLGVEPELLHRLAQLRERLGMRRAALPEQQLHPWLRHLQAAYAVPPRGRPCPEHLFVRSPL